MRKIWMLSLCGITALSVAAKASAEDVYVDLSALDELSIGENATVNSQPLFPIVKKAEPRPVRVKKAAKKPAAVKVRAIAKPAEKPVVETVVKPVDTAKAPTEEKNPAAEALTAAPVTEEVVAVGVTAGETASSTAQEEAEVKAPEAVAEIPFVTSSEPVVVVDVEPTSSANSENKAPEAAVPAAPETEEPEAAPVEEPAAAPVEESAAAVNPVLTFAGENDELSAEQQQQLDALMASFKDPANNKIAIHSYNLDDGIDVFRKKRISLNRATNVRSYLLQKGYKNFSIKVINVEPGSDKAHRVEIEELL